MLRSFDLTCQTKSTRLFVSLAICLATVFLGLVVLSRPASAAAPCVFQAQQNNDFVNVGNWSCGHTPTLGDDVWISAGTTTNLNATSSIIVQSVSVSGTLNVVSGFFEATSTATVILQGTVTSTSGVMRFNTVTSTGNIGTGTGTINASSTIQNNGTFNVGGGSVTSTGSFTNASTTRSGSGTLTFGADFINTGTFTAGGGSVRLVGAADQALAAVTFYKLFLQMTDGKVATLAGNSTVSNTFGLETGILAVNTRTFTVSGAYTNTGGQVLISSGSLVHASTNAFTESDGTSSSTVQATFTANGSLYVTLTDANRNLSATNTETLTVTVAATAASGSDSETLTLTETSVSSGIFRNATALPLAYVINAVLNDGSLSIHASDTGTASYTDTYDAADITTDTVTLTLAVPTPAAAATNTGGPGGGGGGGGSITLFNYSNLPSPVAAPAAAPVATLTSLPLTFVANSLVKLANDGNTATQQDSAVYYYGKDGRRHAFPNDKAFFTWYSDFSQVQVISAAEMARMPLGQNVTYRPGVRMVKFATLNRVYAVDAGGLLHWVKTEVVANALYGSTWNKQIDDINDAFFANYRFGSDINSTADFTPSAAMTAASSIQKDMGF